MMSKISKQIEQLVREGARRELAKPQPRRFRVATRQQAREAIESLRRSYLGLPR